MRIFPPPIEIAEREGFSPEKDIFGRSEIGSGLTNLVGSVTDPLVLAIDGQWGSGKTTFLKMWAGMLRQEGFPVIYFDAFENDYSEDAFTVIAGEIISLTKQGRIGDNKKVKLFIDRAIGAGKVIARSALKVGVKAATMGALQSTDLEDFSEAISEEIEDVTDKHIGELLTQHAERRDAISVFKDSLREVSSIIGADYSNTRSLGALAAPRPLIFIIDELDRCRPNFALNILERIKHLFSVTGVHFVLGTHTGQLKTSIQAAYGSNIDAGKYLQKFIQLTFPLVDSSRDKDRVSNIVYINYLVDKLDFPSDDHDLVTNAINFIKSSARARQFSLRAVERIMTALTLAIAYTPRNRFRPGDLIAGLCILRVLEPELYAKAKSGFLQFEDIQNVFGFGISDEYGKSIFKEWQINIWQFTTNRNLGSAFIDEFSRQLMAGRYHFESRFDLVPFVANEIVDRLKT